VTVSPWDCAFEGDRCGEFPPSDLADPETRAGLAERMTEYGEKAAESKEFHGPVHAGLRDEYFSIVPVEMSISLIADRLRTGHYHSSLALFQDINHLAFNCFLFNEPDSIYA
jgi:hypothetical protein